MDKLADPDYVKGKLIKFINCRLLRNHKLVEDYLLILDGVIQDPQVVFWDHLRRPDIYVDCKGGIISPGYIDIQLNGSIGYDFSSDLDDIQEAVDNVSKAQLLMGVTSYCPTMVSSPSEKYHQILPFLGPRAGSIENGAEIIGAHVEGPFINPEKKGAHDMRVLRDAKNGINDFYDCYGKDNLIKYVKYATVASEIPGVMDSIEQLIEETGIVVSQGHSLATVQQAETAFNKGIHLVTHMYNAMATFHQRDPGIVGMLGSPHRDLFYGIICDGIHVYPNSAKIAYYAHPRGAVLVTDAMCAQCLANGDYNLGDMSVQVKDGSVYITGTETIAGSVADMSECVKKFVKFTNATKIEALEAATLHPAQALKIEHKKGTLNHFADADLLILDDDLSIKRIFISGVEATKDSVKFHSKFQDKK
ncbi:hypothetical protein BB561_001148 [Smittium simulii]|uniref:N-acetylglucosamine-6-phosphate deacetylase n=1 Tax=Smittium simulii TaxID=133385 RepID=A0A2T9YVX0_9FUNG|nr:hypothetical protein BB561_001148 [Smittium simulii]